MKPSLFKHSLLLQLTILIITIPPTRCQEPYSRPSIKQAFDTDWTGAAAYGTGIDLADPANPRSVTRQLLRPRLPRIIQVESVEGSLREMPTTGAINLSSVRNQLITTFTHSTESSDFSSRLSAELGTRFGFGSASAAAKHVADRRASKTLMLFTLESLISNLQPEPDLELDNKYRDDLKKIDAERDPNKRYDLFVHEFGTHYIASLQHGCRLSALIEVNSSDTSKSLEVQAKFASCMTSGRIGVAEDTTFKNYGVTVKGIFSGDIQNNYIIIDNINELISTVSKIRNREISIRPIPIKYEAKTLRTKLGAYSNIYALLSPTQPQQPTSDFGVPSGTIVAWKPKNLEQMIRDGKQLHELLIPKGWSLCDGNDGRPNLLSGRFLAGTDELGQVNTDGGSSQHTHSSAVGGPIGVRTGADTGRRFEAMGIDHTHSINIGTASNLPPHVKVLFIIRN